MANRRDYYTQSNGRMDYVYNQPGGNSSGSDTVSPARIAERVATDYNRRKPVGRSWLPPTAYFLQTSFEDKPHGTVQWTNTGYKFTETGYSTTIPGPRSMMNEDAQYGSLCSIVFPSDLANRALTKARIKAKQETVNLAVAFKEREETARFVAGGIKRLAGLVDAVVARRGDLFRYLKSQEGGRRLVKDIPDWWLEFQYAAKPTLMDIHGAVEALDSVERTGYVVTVKASAKSVQEFNAPAGPIQSRERRLCDHKVIHGSYIRIDMVPGANALQKAASLGFTNPLNVLWERTTFSFLLDYVWPLGDYFSQFDGLVGWEVLGYSQSNLTKADFKYRGLSHTGLNGWQWQLDWKSNFRYVRLDRTAGTVVPFATLPRVKDHTSGTHVINALALLASRINPFGKRR